jgi:hypothetical protein
MCSLIWCFGLGTKEDESFVAKAYVLRALTHIEADFDRPPACVAAADLPTHRGGRRVLPQSTAPADPLFLLTVDELMT